MSEGKSIGSLLIKIAADTAMLRAGIKQSAADIKGFEKSLSTLKHALLGAFSGAALIEGMKSSLESFMEHEKAAMKLSTALKGNQKQFQELAELAEKQRGVTIFGDEASLDAMGRMRAIMGDNIEAITKLLPLVQDFATVKQIELSQAAEIVAKSISSGTNALKRYGITITGAAGSNERAESAVKALTKAFEGQAEAAGNTLYGQLIKTKNAWDEVKKSIGSVLAPMVQRSAKAWQVWAEVMNSNASAWEKFTTTFTRASKLIEIYNEKYEKLGENLERIKKNSEIKMSPDGSYIVPDEKHGGSGLTGIIPGSEDVKKTDALAAAVKKLTYAELQLSLARMSSDSMGPAGLYGLTGKGNTGVSAARDPNMDNGINSMRATQNNVWEQKYEQYKAFAERMKASTEDMSKAISRGFEDMASGFGESLGTMLATGKKLDFSFIIRSFGDMATQIGKVLIASGMAGIALKKLIVNPYLSVAAGIALVALGTAAKASISNITSGTSNQTGSVSTGSARTEGYSFNRNLGDLKPITVNVVGTIKGNDIRLAYDRSKSQHNNGY